MKRNSVRAYWFNVNGRAQYGNRIFNVRKRVYTQGGPIVPCQNGLHASEHPFDALFYAITRTLTLNLDLVELSGTLVDGRPDDRTKVAASKRRHLKRIDAYPVVERFARWCALQVTGLWDCPPEGIEYLENADVAKIESITTAPYGKCVRTYIGMCAYNAAWFATKVVTSGANWLHNARCGVQNALAANPAMEDRFKSKFQEMVDEEFAKEPTEG